MKNKIEKIFKKSYLEFQKLNKKQKKTFSHKIVIKGKGSIFDSVDIVTFFSILDDNFKTNQVNIPELLDEKFFFKYKNISFKTLINYIYDKKKK